MSGQGSYEETILGSARPYNAKCGQGLGRLGINGVKGSSN